MELQISKTDWQVVEVSFHVFMYAIRYRFTTYFFISNYSCCCCEPMGHCNGSFPEAMAGDVCNESGHCFQQQQHVKLLEGVWDQGLSEIEARSCHGSKDSSQEMVDTF